LSESVSVAIRASTRSERRKSSSADVFDDLEHLVHAVALDAGEVDELTSHISHIRALGGFALATETVGSRRR
jgi:hypothetical protein